MTISITITGHGEGKDGEQKMLDCARQAVKDMAEHGEVYTASASTTHQGQVNLRDAPEVVDTSDPEHTERG